jgi:hypothetical protein
MSLTEKTMKPQALIGIVLILAVPSGASAFERDSHYYLRFGLSLITCFNWEESHLIASGDWAIDENRVTTAEMNPIQHRNKVQWHAFGHSDQRFNELWQRSREEKDLQRRLVLLGQFMHFLEDWESHAGYGVRMGHARATFSGRDPDSLGSSKIRNRRMVQSALEHLLRTCDDLERLDSNVDEIMVRTMKVLDDVQLLQGLFEASDPAWKRGKLGGFRRRGAEIMTVNKTRVEEMIERFVAPIPQKNVPKDFKPGDPERGLPPSLGLMFDRDGNVLNVLDLAADVLAAHAKAAHFAPDLAVNITKARARKKRWRVRVEVFNRGEEGVSDVRVDVVVIDSGKETVLARKSGSVPVIAAGKSVKLSLNLPSNGRPSDDVIYGAYISGKGDDDWVNNIDWQMRKEVANERPDVRIIDDVDECGDDRLAEFPERCNGKGPIEAVQFLEPPKLYVVGNRACFVITALTAEGDSTEKLGDVKIGLVSADGKTNQLLGSIPPLWSALATNKKLVAGKLVACFRPTPAHCRALWTTNKPRLLVEISVHDKSVEPVHEIIPIDLRARRIALQACDPFGVSVDMYDDIQVLRKKTN